MLEYVLYAHIAAAILATFVIFRWDYHERPQAVGQALVAWIIPVLGPILILIFQSVVHRNMSTKAQPDSENHYRDEGLAADLHAEVAADD